MRLPLDLALAIASVCILTSCKMPTEKQDLSKLTDDFVYGALALSPVSATSAGYHEHKGVNLDEQIDDFSAAGLDQQHKFYSDFHNRLAAIQQDSLSAEDRADYQIIDNQINLALLELDQIQSYPQSDRICRTGGQRGVQSFRSRIRSYRSALSRNYPALAEDPGAGPAG